MTSKRVRLSSGEVLDAIDAVESSRVRPPPPLPPAKSVSFELAPVVVVSPRTDLEVLDAIMSDPTRLTTAEARAFGGMRQYVTRSPLSYAQRSWAQEVAARLGFDVESPKGWREAHAAVRAIPDKRRATKR
jgi:hypothetical protein